MQMLFAVLTILCLVFQNANVKLDKKKKTPTAASSAKTTFKVASVVVLICGMNVSSSIRTALLVAERCGENRWKGT